MQARPQSEMQACPGAYAHFLLFKGTAEHRQVPADLSSDAASFPAQSCFDLGSWFNLLRIRIWVVISTTYDCPEVCPFLCASQVHACRWLTSDNDLDSALKRSRESCRVRRGG